MKGKDADLTRREVKGLDQNAYFSMILLGKIWMITNRDESE